MKKAMAKRNKKGFTMIELIIVIAILAILAAIAIPVINTTVNSAKLSSMESDTQTLDMLLKAAVTEMESDTGHAIYNNAPVGPGTNINDIMVESHIPTDLEFSRTIGNVTYYMVWEDKELVVSTNPAHVISADTTLALLSRT